MKRAERRRMIRKQRKQPFDMGGVVIPHAKGLEAGEFWADLRDIVLEDNAQIRALYESMTDPTIEVDLESNHVRIYESDEEGDHVGTSETGNTEA